MAWPEPSQPGVGHFSSCDRPGSPRPHPELKGKLQHETSEHCSEVTAAAATLQLTIGYPVHHSIVTAAVQRCTLHTAPPQYGIQLVFILVYCVDSLSVDRR